MKILNKIITSILFVILITSCNSTLFISRNNQLKKAEKYKKECIPFINKFVKDTISISDNKICIISNNKYFSVGSIKNGKKKGIWYFYKLSNNKFECHYIARVKKNGEKAYIYSLGLINQRYF